MTEARTEAAVPRRKRFSWLRMSVVLLLMYVCLVGCAVLFEDKFIYFPTRYPDGYWSVAKSQSPLAPRIEDVFMEASDGVRIHGWYCKPALQEADAVTGELSPARQDSEGRPVILFLHGNAGNLTYRYDIVQMLLAMDTDVFIIDYHGYGKSEGEPGEAALYADAQAAWDELTITRKIDPKRIILFGKSLGSAPAIELATRVEPAGIVVEAAFTSVPDMASSVLPIVPKFAISTKMNSIDRIANVKCPKLFTHSPVDEMIPYEHGRRLYEAASEPKTFYAVERAKHNDMHVIGGTAYREALRKFFDECTDRKSP